MTTVARHLQNIFAKLRGVAALTGATSSHVDAEEAFAEQPLGLQTPAAIRG